MKWSGLIAGYVNTKIHLILAPKRVQLNPTTSIEALKKVDFATSTFEKTKIDRYESNGDKATLVYAEQTTTAMNTIKIGLQEWATEDLNVTKFRNGEDIPLVTDAESWVNLKTAAYVISPNGHYLYNWYAVNDPRGLAPEGFYVPASGEWTELVNYLGGDEVAGHTMKSSRSDTPAWDGRNSSGFSALPGGFRNGSNGNFYNFGTSGCWWSSSPSGSNAWSFDLHTGDSDVYRDYYDVRFGFSVRCVRD